MRRLGSRRFATPRALRLPLFALPRLSRLTLPAGTLAIGTLTGFGVAHLMVPTAPIEEPPAAGNEVAGSSFVPSLPEPADPHGWLAPGPVLEVTRAAALGRLVPRLPDAASDTALTTYRPDGDDAARFVLASLPDSVIEEPYRMGEERRAVEVASGDTLMELLTDEAVDAEAAHAAIEALSAVYDPRGLKAGQAVTLVFAHNGRASEFAGLEIPASIDTDVVVTRAPGGAFSAAELKQELETRPAVAAGEIDTSLYVDATEGGVPTRTVLDVIRGFSYKVDFQRDIQPGDRFEVFYDDRYFTDGRHAEPGELQFARLTLSGKDIEIFRFESEDGRVDYYDRTGESARRLLMRTPIDGARLSSGFGMRRHPILGYGRMHKGVDFAAPTGTPIYAAGDGVVDFIGRNKGYGNYVRIRHNGRLMTAYAHMSRFAKLDRGDRVTQGEVIGYVGSTGQSTGPHLHYEVLVGDVQTNPMDIDLPTGNVLEGSELASFKAKVEDIDARMAELRAAVPVAAAD